MTPKFGMQVDFGLPDQAKLPQTKSEVELPRRGRHLEKSM